MYFGICKALICCCFLFLFFVTLSIFQSQFTEKGFKKAENSEQNVVILSFLLALYNSSYMLC